QVTALVALLMTGYFTLMVGAPYCHLVNHDRHSSSSTVMAKMHCAMAMHGAMAATLPVQSGRLNPLQFHALVFGSQFGIPGSVDSIANTSRAPPLVSTMA